ncbi:Na(+)-translocating NADH-quinone reductase subunit C [bacterium]|nr:Na(+)-translocating NADH-quinone reductase subunit C [bacterium]
MPDNSVKKTVSVALGVCLVCSVLVSGTAVLLKDRQDENRRLEKIRNILDAGGLYEKGIDMETVYRDRIQPEIVDLSAGRALAGTKYPSGLSPESFDILAVAGSETLGRRLPDGEDPAQIQRIPRYMQIYTVKADSGISMLILPVYGKGLWSTMFGFIALDRDLQTVRGFTFYEHGETPGLGGEVDNPAWKREWIGKRAYDERGNPVITVVKGTVQPDDPAAGRKIDGLSGATLTTRGVDNLVRFWLGDNGYGPYIRRLKDEVTAP